MHNTPKILQAKRDGEYFDYLDEVAEDFSEPTAEDFDFEFQEL